MVKFKVQGLPADWFVSILRVDVAGGFKVQGFKFKVGGGWD